MVYCVARWLFEVRFVESEMSRSDIWSKHYKYQLYPFMTFEKQFVVCFGPPGIPSGLELCHFLLIAPLIDRLSGELGPDLAFEFHVS